jgi:condensin complex subunit 1
MKDKALRQATTRLIAGVVARFPTAAANAASRLVAALTLHEHAVPVASDIVVAWSGGGIREVCSVAAAEALRELGRLSGTVGSDAAALRRASAFVIDIAERQPRLVLANVAILLPFLECDAYTMRSAVVTVLGGIISRSFSDATHITLPDATRAELLSILHTRSFDVHSLTRAAALKAWTALASNAAIPQDELPSVAALATDRLRDKGVLVRRAALHLLRALVEHNPFGPHANAQVYEAHAQQAEQWLRQHPEPAEPLPVAAPADVDVDRIASDASAAAANDTESARFERARTSALLAASFSRTVEGAIPILEQMLTSKTGSDVMGAIRFLSRARSFDIPGASQGLAQMLTLVWSAEAGVREEVVSETSERAEKTIIAYCAKTTCPSTSQHLKQASPNPHPHLHHPPPPISRYLGRIVDRSLRSIDCTFSARLSMTTTTGEYSPL